MPKKLSEQEVENFFNPKMLEIFNQEIPNHEIKNNPFNKNIKYKHLIYSFAPCYSLFEFPFFNDLVELSKNNGENGFYFGSRYFNKYKVLKTKYFFIEFDKYDFYEKEFLFHFPFILSENFRWGILLYDPHIGVSAFKYKEDIQELSRTSKSFTNQLRDYLDSMIYYNRNPISLNIAVERAKKYLFYLYGESKTISILKKYKLIT